VEALQDFGFAGLFFVTDMGGEIGFLSKVYFSA